MIEFSIVVLLSRRENVKINSADNPDEIEKEESVLDLHYFNNKVFDTLFGQDQQFKFAEEIRNKITNGNQKARTFSSKTLDMVSSFVFPIAYAIFNLCYWYKMKN